jgi:tetratricopeptide (TPR) repeat protein
VKFIDRCAGARPPPRLHRIDGSPRSINEGCGADGASYVYAMSFRSLVLVLFAVVVVLWPGCRPAEDPAPLASNYALDSTTFRAELDAAREANLNGEFLLADSLGRAVMEGARLPERGKQLVMAYSAVAHSLQGRRQLDSALYYFERAVEVASRYQQYKDMAVALNNMATVLQDKGDYELALVHLLRSRDLRQQAGDSAGMAKSWNNLGILLMRKNDTLAADDAFRNAVAINERTHDSSSWSKSLANRAVVQLDLQHYDTALVLLQRAAAVRPGVQFGRSEAYLYTNTGLAHEGLGRLDEARADYARAIRDAAQEGDEVTVAGSHMYLADLLVRSGEHALARIHLDTAVAIARRTDATEYLKDAYLTLAESHAATGDHESAYRHYRTYDALADSLMNADKDRTMSELLVQNDVQRRERENTELRTEQALAELRARDLRVLLAVVCLLAVAVAVLAWSLVQRTRERARRRETELEQQALRLQMDPHFLFNALNTIPGLYASTDARTATTYVSHLSNLLRLILETSRTMQVPLRQELELLEHYLAVSTSRHSGVFSWWITVDPTLDRDAVRIPPMLLQPLVENAVHHGLVPRKRDGELHVEVARTGDTLVCRVRDNGIGRAARQRTKGEVLGASRGLQITAERLEQLNRGRAAEDGIRIVDLHDAEGRPTGTEVVVRTFIEPAW